MKIDIDEIKQIIDGSTIFGTGGGGSYTAALEITKDIVTMELCPISELNDNDRIVTLFTAGGLTKRQPSDKTFQKVLNSLETLVGKIQAVIPVEIGPYSVASAMYSAQRLGLPLVDGDLVGGRSVPEIFIELVTLAGIERCPLVLANEDGDLLTLNETMNAETLEKIVRGFADASSSVVLVGGYAFDKSQLAKCTAAKTISSCSQIKSSLMMQDPLCKGEVIFDKKEEQGGFTVGSLVVAANNGRWQIDFKNEYIILRKDDDVVITCPDLIMVLDEETGLGLNNGENNLGKAVAIYTQIAMDPWRTPIGMDLFSPRNLGFDCEQKVLNP